MDQVEWKPLAASTANFRTMRLCDLGADGLVYRPTTGGLLFLGSIAFMAMAVGVIALVAAAKQEPEAAFIGGPFLAIGLGFGYFVARKYTKAPFFDARARRFARSGGPGESAVEQRADAVPFHAIRALQLIAYYVSGDSDSRGYHVLQLNVVTHDGKRVHVTTSADGSSLEEEAAMIARLVNVPIWREPARPTPSSA